MRNTLMLIPIRWLREYVAFDLEVPQLAEGLTMAGLEVAAITGGVWQGPTLDLQADGPPEPELSVTIEAPDLCSRYAARIIRGVKVADSPEWLQARLRA